MKKRGLLLAEETLRIIVAVITISFLVYFLVSLYSSSQNSKNLEFAKESLSHLIEEINAEKPNVEIYNPNGWSLSSWSFENIPLSCSNLGWQSCLCICDTPSIGFSSNYLENCDNKGICLENSENLVVVREDNQLLIKISDPPITLAIDYINKKITKVR